MQAIRLPCIQIQIKLIPDTFVLQNKKFLLAIIDDFHVIHTPQDPKDATTSVALHMATEIVDVHDSLAAIPLPTDTLKIHQSAFVGQRLCRGGIHLPNILRAFNNQAAAYFLSSYLGSLPLAFRQFNMERADDCIEHLR